jgi:phosphate uptake regulator
MRHVDRAVIAPREGLQADCDRLDLHDRLRLVEQVEGLEAVDRSFEHIIRRLGQSRRPFRRMLVVEVGDQSQDRLDVAFRSLLAVRQIGAQHGDRCVHIAVRLGRQPHDDVGHCAALPDREMGDLGNELVPGGRVLAIAGDHQLAFAGEGRGELVQQPDMGADGCLIELGATHGTALSRSR